MIVDAVVCLGPHHKHVALKSLRSLHVFGGVGNIHLVASSGVFEDFSPAEIRELALVHHHEDETIDGVTLASLRAYMRQRGARPDRAGWYLQQFLKMGFCRVASEDSHYLVWDSDTVLLQPMEFLDSQGRALVNPQTECHRPYFRLLHELLGIRREVDFSFIAEHILVHSAFMRDLIGEIEARFPDAPSWVFAVLDLIEDENLGGSGFSEYETYGNYVHARHPDAYARRPLSSLREGGMRTGRHPSPHDLCALAEDYAYATFEPFECASTARILWNRTLSRLARMRSLISRGRRARYADRLRKLSSVCGCPRRVEA